MFLEILDVFMKTFLNDENRIADAGATWTKVSRTLIQVEFGPNVILIFILLFFLKILFPVF